MSQSSRTFDCHRCNESFERGFDRQYCSEECFFREKGEGILQQIEQDHRICNTCYRPMRTIDKPSSDWIEKAESHIQAAMEAGAELVSADQSYSSDFGGVKVHSELDYTPVSGGKRRIHAQAVIGHQYPTEHTLKTTEGWACQCGNTDHRHHEDAIVDSDVESVITFLYFALQQLHREGHISQSPARSELFEGLREHWKDWEYAVGRCLHK